MDLAQEADRYWAAKDDRVDQERLGMLLALVPPRSKVLVIDGGPGMLAERLRAAGHEVCMTEVSVLATRRAQLKSLHAVACDTDAEPLPFPDAHFNCVISDSGMEHRYHHQRVLSEGVRVLAHGGTFLLLIPNIAHWRHRLHLLCGRMPEIEGAATDRCHLRFFARPELQRMLRAQGLRVHHTSGYAALWVKGLWPAVCRAPVARSVFGALAKLWPSLFARDLIFSSTKTAPPDAA